MVFSETIAGLGALKSAFDMAKGLKDIDDTVRRNSAVIELQEKILSAQAAQGELLDSVRSLEAEVASLKTWDAEKQRYELKTIGSGAVAYMLKADARGSEPPHWICPNCYAKGQKAFFQPTGAHIMRDSVYRCQGCAGNVTLGGEPTWIA